MSLKGGRLRVLNEGQPQKGTTGTKTGGREDFQVGKEDEAPVAETRVDLDGRSP